ncbi:MAG: diaminopimelate dehydrogenase [Clostridiales bacterium]|nr:diaminopimelate dehydrogenase [Clostridiales bacterium]
MTGKIRIGIVGYGNLGKGAEKAVAQNPDFELVKIFIGRDPNQLEAMKEYVGKIDFMLLCIGSSVDLPIQGPRVAELFNTVDTFDTHAKVPEYFASMDEAARRSGKLAMIATGWDPGLFSVLRVLMGAALPEGKTNTFWGWGVSQGHGEAIKRVPGVQIARSYTVPVGSTLEKARGGDRQDFTTRQMHTRDCYVVLQDGADPEQVRQAIVSLPNYFAPYDTTVTFIDMDTFEREHNTLPHGGFVIRSGSTGEGSDQLMEFQVRLASNPEFTASVMLSYCRAASRLYGEGRRGAITAFDVPVGYLALSDMPELRKSIL